MSEHPVPETTPTRRCWRCLQQFPLDPTLPGGHPTEWWVCETCHAALLPDRP